MFCGEQGVDRGAKLDGRDADAFHLAGVEGGRVIAACLFEGDAFRLVRMAVAATLKPQPRLCP